MDNPYNDGMNTLKQSLYRFSHALPRIFMVLLAVFVCIEILFLTYGWGKDHTNECTASQEQVKRKCFIETVRKALVNQGIDGAYKKINALYLADPRFADVCHTLTHEIGAYAYDQFQQGKPIVVSRDFSICSYGFYHGYMERLAGQKDIGVKARAFCDEVDRQMKLITPDAALQCFHGIGHGYVNNHNPRTWGNEQLMIGPALALCERVAVTDSERSRCATGVFNGIATFYAEGLYNLKVNANDPLWICRMQAATYQDACYISLNITLLQLTDGNLVKAATYLEPITDEQMANHAMINLAAPVGSKNISSTNHQETITACRAIQERLHMACIAGYAYGMLEQGLPGEEYRKPLAFCRLSALTKSERDACFLYIIRYLPQWYPKQKVGEICTGDVPEEYRSYCI